MVNQNIASEQRGGEWVHLGELLNPLLHIKCKSETDFIYSNGFHFVFN